MSYGFLSNSWVFVLVTFLWSNSEDKLWNRTKNLEGCLTVHLPHEIMLNASLMQLGNFIDVFLGLHVSAAYIIGSIRCNKITLLHQVCISHYFKQWISINKKSGRYINSYPSYAKEYEFREDTRGFVYEKFVGVDRVFIM